MDGFSDRGSIPLISTMISTSKDWLAETLMGRHLARKDLLGAFFVSMICKIRKIKTINDSWISFLNKKLILFYCNVSRCRFDATVGAGKVIVGNVYIRH